MAFTDREVERWLVRKQMMHELVEERQRELERMKEARVREYELTWAEEKEKTLARSEKMVSALEGAKAKLEEKFYEPAAHFFGIKAAPPKLAVHAYKMGEPIRWEDLGFGPPPVSPVSEIGSPVIRTPGSLRTGAASGPAPRYPHGTRIFPKEMAYAIKELRETPTAMTVLYAMTTALSHGSVVKATRQKILELTGLSPSSYTRAINTLLGMGFLWPNIVSDGITPGYLIEKDYAPNSKNGARYKLAPFLAFRGDADYRELELRKYNGYMRQRLAKRLTPTYDELDNSVAFVEAPQPEDAPHE